MKYLYLYCIIIFMFSCVSPDGIKENKVVNPDYDKAYEYIDVGKTDSSFFFFDKARQVFLDNKDSLGVAKCLVNMAITLKDQNDYFGAQETALQAVSYMNVNNPKHQIYLSTNYNNLGVASSALGQYETALSFYELALKFSNDSLNTFGYQNNIAICYQNLRLYDKAIGIYNNLLVKTKNTPKPYAQILSNLARAKWLQNSHYHAERELLEACAIRARENDFWGLNASYGHLADYYTAHDINTALQYAKKMYKVAEELKSADDQIYALGKLVELTTSNSAKEYFRIYRNLSDSVQLARAAAKNQFAVIRYEVEKNKTENLRLEKENTEKQYRLTRQRVITVGTVFLLVLAVGGGSIWYKRRKQRLELEAENKVKETQLHLSKKVHDVVANDIYRVMTEVEYKDNLDREGLLDKLEVIYNQSRDISHNVEQRSIAETSYNEQISSLLRSFASANCHISIAGNDAGQWTDVSPRIREEIKHVLQELMVNMKKHSRAEQIVVRFEKLDRKLKIFYKDNGVGLQTDKSEGKGMVNTVSRIESLGGEIIFANTLGKGLTVNAVIPLI